VLGVKGADCQKLTLKIEQELGEVYHTEARRATPNPPPSPGPNPDPVPVPVPVLNLGEVYHKQGRVVAERTLALNEP